MGKTQNNYIYLFYYDLFGVKTPVSGFKFPSPYFLVIPSRKSFSFCCNSPKLFLSSCSFLSIFIIVDLIENLDRFMDNKVPSIIVLEYYIYTLPYFISIGLPMAVLISTVFSLGSMVKRNEWTAMKASGISIYRIALPLVICGIILSGCSFVLDNKLVAYGNEKRFEIDRDHVKRKSRHKLKNTLKEIFLQKNSSTHISLSKYYIKKSTGHDLTIVDLGQSIIRERIDAKKIIWNSDSSKWSISDYSIRRFNQNGLETNVILGISDTIMDLGFSPMEIQQQARKPDELDYYRLTERINQLKDNMAIFFLPAWALQDSPK